MSRYKGISGHAVTLASSIYTSRTNKDIKPSVSYASTHKSLANP